MLLPKHISDSEAGSIFQQVFLGFKRCRQPGCRRSGAQGFWLRGMRGPSRQVNHLKRRRDRAVIPAVAGVINLLCAPQNRRFGRDGAGGWPVRCFPPLPAARASGGGRAIGYRQPGAVGHGQGKAGALQQAAKVANFRHWRNARRQPACDLDLGLCQGRALSSKRV